MRKNKLGDLNDHIFESIQMLKDGDMDIETAKGIAQLAQVAVNVTKTQLDGVRTFAMLGGEFAPLAFEQGQNLLGGETAQEIFDEPVDTDSYAIPRTKESRSKPTNNDKKTSDSIPDDPFDGLKVTKTQKEILDFLIEAGGESRVGLIGDTRAKTIRHLEILEEKGVIKCVVRPQKIAWGSDVKKMPFEVLNYCGIWRLKRNIAQPA